MRKLIEKKSVEWWDQARFNHLREQMPPGLRWVRLTRPPRETAGKVIGFRPHSAGRQRQFDTGHRERRPGGAPVSPSPSNVARYAFATSSFRWPFANVTRSIPCV